MNAPASLFDARNRRYEQARAAVDVYPWTESDPITDEECEQSRQETALITTPGLSPADAALKIDLFLWWYQHRPGLYAALTLTRDALLAGELELAARAFDWFLIQPGANYPFADFDLTCLRVLSDDLARFRGGA